MNSCKLTKNEQFNKNNNDNLSASRLPRPEQPLPKFYKTAREHSKTDRMRQDDNIE